jgi:hypothetical protein
MKKIVMVCVDCVDQIAAYNAVNKSLKQFKPHRTMFFTDIDIADSDQIEVVKIPKIESTKGYSDFMIRELVDYMPKEATHILVIQADGYVLDGTSWTDEFLEYDYIGAPWLYDDEDNVGNGGFSMRSVALMKEVQKIDPPFAHPEDWVICRFYGEELKKKGFKFAPEELAYKFAFEGEAPKNYTFGFHSKYHQRFRPIVVIQSITGLSNAIKAEPIITAFIEMGFKVCLDMNEEDYLLYDFLGINVSHASWLPEDINVFKVIDIDTDEDYYQLAGIEGLEPRMPAFKHKLDPAVKFFDKYCVLDIDEEPEQHIKEKVIEAQMDGYFLLQLGSSKIGTKMNLFSGFLFQAVAQADMFIGKQGDIAQLSLAFGVPAVI